MKTAVLIIGTNAVGKSTIARGLLNKAGGSEKVDNDITFCADGRTAIIGDYSKGKKIEGVDSFGVTKIVAEKVKAAEREIVIFEGLKCGTFGESIQNALFAADNQIVVFLYASANCINERLLKRSGTGIKTVQVLKQQRANLNAAAKYKEIGIPVLYYNTELAAPEEICENIQNKIKEVRNEL